MSEDQKPLNAPAVADDEEAVFQTDDGRAAPAPFQKGTEIQLNGRAFICRKLTKQDVILEKLGDVQGATVKPIQINDQFEYRGWLFRIVRITAAHKKKKPNRREKWFPYTLAVRPVGIRKTTAARLLVSNTVESPNAPTGFVIERTDAGESPIPGVSDVEDFAQRILDRLSPPDGSEVVRAAWALGVQQFFEGKKEAECPWDTSEIIRIGEADRTRLERITLGTFWGIGWNSAYSASLIVYREVLEQSGGQIEDAEIRLAADAEAEAQKTPQADPQPPVPFVVRPAARELFEQARRFAEGRGRGKAEEDICKALAVPREVLEGAGVVTPQPVEITPQPSANGRPLALAPAPACTEEARTPNPSDGASLSPEQPPNPRTPGRRPSRGAVSDNEKDGRVE